jgi:hypothetical protein
MEQNITFIFRFSDLNDRSFQAGLTKTDAVFETASVSSFLKSLFRYDSFAGLNVGDKTSKKCSCETSN